MSENILLEVKQRACRLLLQLHKICEEQMKLQAEDDGEQWEPGAFSSKHTPWSNIDLQEQWERLDRIGKAYQWRLDKFMCQVAANKDWRDLLTPWMVDISGVAIGPERNRHEKISGGEGSFHITEEDLFERFDNIKDFVSSYGGANFDEMMEFLQDNGFNPTDMGAGARGWAIGCPCSDSEANKLCDLIHVQFADEIEYGQLQVTKNFWGFRFADLYNECCARLYAEEHSLEPNENGDWIILKEFH